ncbi:MAG: hypothetical protein EXS33_08495 [Pedosphaera sp.]|nr:hypothetical protein [Pedosphaera sp.]
MSTERKTSAGFYIVAIIGAFLIMALLVRSVIERTTPAPVGQERTAERVKLSAELKAENALALETCDWVDKAKGIVRLPVSEAMKLTVQEWKNPAAARSNLIARVEKATAKVPEKPSEFE